MNLARRIVGASLRMTMLPLRRGPHITRYSMYRRLGELRLGSQARARVLSISHSESLCALMGLTPETADIQMANYPEENILGLSFADGSFDFVVADQVLEHVAGNPQKAIDECFRVLRRGGQLVLTTCFINPVHGAPGDFWRFTPEALRLLCENAGAEVVEASGWGNRYVWFVDWLGLRFAGVPDARWHPLHLAATSNDPSWPVTTWVIARKRGTNGLRAVNASG